MWGHVLREQASGPGQSEKGKVEEDGKDMQHSRPSGALSLPLRTMEVIERVEQRRT